MEKYEEEEHDFGIEVLGTELRIGYKHGKNVQND